MNFIQSIVIFGILIIVPSTHTTASESELESDQYKSPCARIFTYEAKGKENDRWYGILTVLKNTELRGVWLRILFDRPVKQLGNWFGEVEKRSENQTDFLIRNPKFMLKAYTSMPIRIFVVYDVNQPPPKLTEFRINGEVVCPENLATTTPSTTTEQLFTSMWENLNDYDIKNNNNNYQPLNVGATTYRPPHEAGYAKPEPQTHSNSISYNNVSDICGTVAITNRFDRHIAQVAHKGEYPWHAMIFFTKGITINYLCGASLISNRHLLTVAHCVIKIGTLTPVDPDYLVIYLGRYFVKQLDHGGSQLNYVENIVPHPEYNPQTYNNDIALLRLFTPVNFTNYVRPICLWKESDDLTSVINRPGTVVGWGFDETGKIEEKLMFVHMFAQDNEKCSKAISQYWNKITTNKTFCANFIDDSVECVGDSGGAVVYPTVDRNREKSVWHIRGLLTVSVVIQKHLKCDRNQYVIFTDVAKYNQWIEEYIKS